MNVNSDGTSYFDGDVGVGTTNPGGIFEVFKQSTGRTRGDLLVDVGAKYVYVGRLSTTSGDVSSFKVRDRLNRAYFDVNTASKYISFNPEVGDITMQIASGYGFKVNGGQFNVNATSGNVGIGTTSPYAKLEAQGPNIVSASPVVIKKAKLLNLSLATSAYYGGFAELWMGRYADVSNHAKSILTFSLNDGLYGSNTNADTDVMTLRGDGKVGIGTTSPGAKLSLYDATEDVSINVNTGLGGSYPKKTGISFGATSTSLGGDAEFTGGAGIQAINTAASGNPTDLTFWTNSVGTPAERMRISSGGMVGIGTTPSYLLDVRKGTVSGAIARFSAINPHVVIESSTAGNSVLHFKPNVTSSKSGQFKVTAGNGYNFRWTNDAAGTGETAYMDLDTSTTGGGDLTVKGDIIAYGAPSDRKYKENIKPIESALDKAMQLQGVTFDWKDSESILDIKEDIGFIAQDVEKVLPELVRDNGKGNLSLRYQGITPILLEAIKELKAEIEELKKQIK